MMTTATMKPFLESLQLANAAAGNALERATRTNLEITNSLSKACADSFKAYNEAFNAFCKLCEENVTAASTAARKA